MKKNDAFPGLHSVFQMPAVESLAEVSFRGVSAADVNSFWVSGSRGTIIEVNPEGWTDHSPIGYYSIDFRDIQVVGDSLVIALSAGTPAVILRKQIHGGEWQEVHRDERPEIFYDGMGAWKDGSLLVYGDPIDGKLQLIKSKDAGRSWEDLSFPLPETLGKVHGYAASGTGIVTGRFRAAWIGLGGETTPILFTGDGGQSWEIQPTPMASGGDMRGIFGMAFYDEKNGVIVGGEWKVDGEPGSRAYTNDGGETWKPGSGVDAYRSTVVALAKDLFLASGISGTDLSTDGGKTWENISDDSFQAMATNDHGVKRVCAVGKKGKVVIFQLNY